MSVELQPLPEPGPKKSRPAPTRLQLAAVTMIAATLLSRVLGLVRDIVFAHVFGQTGQTDAYTAALKIPDLMTSLIAGGALSATFIPVFSEYLERKEDGAAWRTFSVVASVTLIAACLFVVAAEIFTPQIVILMNGGYSHHPEKVRLATTLARIVLPAQIFFLLGGLLMGVQNARGKFLIPSLGPSLYNLGIIAGALLAGWQGWGFPAIVWGALAGAFIGNFLLQAIAAVRLGLPFRPSLDLRDPGSIRVWRLMLPIILGVSLPNVDQIINGAFASHLANGCQTALQSANRLMLIPVGVFAQAAAVAAFPTMSRQSATGRRDLLRGTLQRGLSKILFLTVPASALFCLLAVPIVAALFQHGHFHASDTLLTASALRFYAFGIFGWSAQAILTRGFYALQASRYPVISGTVMTILFVAMNAFVVYHTKWGVAGLAAATSMAAIMHALSMYGALRFKMRGLRGGAQVSIVGRIAIATGGLCGVVLLMEHLCHYLVGPAQSSFSAAILYLLLAGAAGCAAYLALAIALRLPEACGIRFARARSEAGATR